MGYIWAKYMVWGLVQLGLSVIPVPKPLKYILIEGAVVNFIIGVLMLLRPIFPKSLVILGKDPKTGGIPWWSWLAFWSFHAINHFSVYMRAWPACTDVTGENKFYLGGYNARLQPRRYAAVVDLTCEFPARMQSTKYLNVRVWDGTPPSTQDINRAIEFCESHHERGPILIHCAYGKGRSTTLMIAFLVHMGVHDTIEEAHDAIRKVRPVISVNASMRRALARWFEERKGCANGKGESKKSK